MNYSRLRIGALALLLMAGLTYGCTATPPAPTVTPSQTSTPSVTPSQTSTPSVTPTATGTSTPTSTPTPTSTATASPTATASSTPAPSQTPTATSTTTPYPEADLLIFERPVDGFAMGLPASWMSIDVSPEGYAKAIKDLASKNPGMAGVLSPLAQAQVISGTKFSALDLGPGAAANGVISNLNIIKQVLTAQASLETLAQASVAQLENLDFIVKPVSDTHVQLQAGPAEELRYQIKLTRPSGQTVRLAISQYLVLDNRDFYVITMAAPAERAVQYRPVFLKIAKSFRLMKLAGVSGRIVFDSQRNGKGNGEIYVMSANGSTLTRLTTNAADDFQGVLSPDGAQIAFVSNRDGNYEIYVMGADGTHPRRLTTNPASDVTPAWSPDGKKLAFFSNRDGNYQIYMMNADGSGQTRLTNDPADDYSPKWSPDGKRIVFFSNRGGNFAILVMNADGSNPIALTTNAADDASPAWSPDGTKIAFNSTRDGNVEIYVMNADGSNQNRLTNNPGSDRTPAWSPDGAWIVFVSNRDGNEEIYAMRADGSSLTRLTNDPASDLFPTWGPASPTS